MSTWQIILIPIALLIIGLIRQILILREKYARLEIADEFLCKFIEWCNGEAKDHSLYNWMLNKSETVQTMLGTGGLIDIQRPFESGYHRNVPIILNCIPEIKPMFNDHLLRDDDNIQQLVQMVDGCLRRFIGSTKEQIQHERIRRFNPLVLFCGGVAWLMELPLFILSETKIITADRRAIITESRIYSLLRGALALVALVAAIVSITVNWDNFVKTVTGWVK